MNKAIWSYKEEINGVLRHCVSLDTEELQKKLRSLGRKENKSNVPIKWEDREPHEIADKITIKIELEEIICLSDGVQR
jgi:hypothetical protein